MSRNKEKHKPTREFKGSAIPVGSRVGKVLLNSMDASKIMDAVRTVASGGKSDAINISEDTIASLAGIYKR